MEVYLPFPSPVVQYIIDTMQLYHEQKTFPNVDDFGQKINLVDCLECALFIGFDDYLKYLSPTIAQNLTSIPDETIQKFPAFLITMVVDNIPISLFDPDFIISHFGFEQLERRIQRSYYPDLNNYPFRLLTQYYEIGILNDEKENDEEDHSKKFQDNEIQNIFKINNQDDISESSDDATDNNQHDAEIVKIPYIEYRKHQVANKLLSYDYRHFSNSTFIHTNCTSIEIKSIEAFDWFHSIISSFENLKEIIIFGYMQIPATTKLSNFLLPSLVRLEITKAKLDASHIREIIEFASESENLKSLCLRETKMGLVGCEMITDALKDGRIGNLKNIDIASNLTGGTAITRLLKVITESNPRLAAAQTERERKRKLENEAKKTKFSRSTSNSPRNRNSRTNSAATTTPVPAVVDEQGENRTNLTTTTTTIPAVVGEQGENMVNSVSTTEIPVQTAELTGNGGAVSTQNQQQILQQGQQNQILQQQFQPHQLLQPQNIQSQQQFLTQQSVTHQNSAQNFIQQQLLQQLARVLQTQQQQNATQQQWQNFLIQTQRQLINQQNPLQNSLYNQVFQPQTQNLNQQQQNTTQNLLIQNQPPQNLLNHQLTQPSPTQNIQIQHQQKTTQPPQNLLTQNQQQRSFANQQQPLQNLMTQQHQFSPHPQNLLTQNQPPPPQNLLTQQPSPTQDTQIQQQQHDSSLPPPQNSLTQKQQQPPLATHNPQQQDEYQQQPSLVTHNPQQQDNENDDDHQQHDDTQLDDITSPLSLSGLSIDANFFSPTPDSISKLIEVPLHSVSLRGIQWDGESASLVREALEVNKEVKFWDLSAQVVHQFSDPDFSPELAHEILKNAHNGIEALFFTNHNLQHINLSCIVHLTNLRALTLTSSNLMDDSIEAIEPLLSNLFFLDLSYNSINFHGNNGSFLSSCVKSPTLKYLILSNNDIGDNGGKLIFDTMNEIDGKTKISTLRLRNCFLRHKSSAALLDLLATGKANFVELDVGGNDMFHKVHVFQTENQNDEIRDNNNDDDKNDDYDDVFNTRFGTDFIDNAQNNGNDDEKDQNIINPNIKKSTIEAFFVGANNVNKAAFCQVFDVIKGLKFLDLNNISTNTILSTSYKIHNLIGISICFARIQSASDLIKILQDTGAQVLWVVNSISYRVLDGVLKNYLAVPKLMAIHIGSDLAEKKPKNSPIPIFIEGAL